MLYMIQEIINLSMHSSIHHMLDYILFMAASLATVLIILVKSFQAFYLIAGLISTFQSCDMSQIPKNNV